MMNYVIAHEMALKKYRACSLKDMAHCSGYAVEGSAFLIEFLGEQYKVHYPSGKFEAVSNTEERLPVAIQILILRYMANPTTVQNTGKLVSYQELPAGSIYLEPFTHRAIYPLVRSFGSHPDNLKEVVNCLGGKSNGLGDVGVTLRVFPHIPLTLILWRADDEFPPSGNILFDSSAPAFLSTEDYAALASAVVFTLNRLSSKL